MVCFLIKFHDTYPISQLFFLWKILIRWQHQLDEKFFFWCLWAGSVAVARKDWERSEDAAPEGPEDGSWEGPGVSFWIVPGDVFWEGTWVWSREVPGAVFQEQTWVWSLAGTGAEA